MKSAVMRWSVRRKTSVTTVKVPSPASARVVFILDLLLEIFLAAALVDVRYVHRRARVVPERAEATAVEVELDQILLHLEVGDGRRFARSDRGPVRLETIPVMLIVERPA